MTHLLARRCWAVGGFRRLVDKSNHMRITYENLFTVSRSHLEDLVRSQVREGIDLEYKLTVPESMREWLKDICALANTRGGVIAFGIREADSIAVELAGLATQEVDTRIRQLQQSADAGIQERIALRFHQVPLDDERTILLAATPDSRFKPHVRLEGMKFYKRTEAPLVQEMTLGELRASILFTQNVEAEMLSRISEEESRVATPPSNHIYTILVAAPTSRQADLLKLSDATTCTWLADKFHPLLLTKSRRITSRELILSGYDRNLLRVSQDGIFTLTLSTELIEPKRLIPTIPFVNEILDSVRTLYQACTYVSRQQDVVVAGCIANCAESTLAPSRMQPSRFLPIQEHILRLSPFELSQNLVTHDAILEAIESWASCIWNANGVHHCDIFDRSTGRPDWTRFVRD